MRNVTFSKACTNFEALIDQVAIDQQPVLITLKSGEDIVMVSAHKWTGMEDTLHLMASSAKAEHLMDDIIRFDNGKTPLNDSEDYRLADERLRNFRADDLISLAAIKAELHRYD